MRGKRRKKRKKKGGKKKFEGNISRKRSSWEMNGKTEERGVRNSIII